MHSLGGGVARKKALENRDRNETHVVAQCFKVFRNIDFRSVALDTKNLNAILVIF